MVDQLKTPRDRQVGVCSKDTRDTNEKQVSGGEMGEEEGNSVAL